MPFSGRRDLHNLFYFITLISIPFYSVWECLVLSFGLIFSLSLSLSPLLSLSLFLCSLPLLFSPFLSLSLPLCVSEFHIIFVYRPIYFSAVSEYYNLFFAVNLTRTAFSLSLPLCLSLSSLPNLNLIQNKK